jgi:hypothetical protein
MVPLPASSIAGSTWQRQQRGQLMHNFKCSHTAPPKTCGYPRCTGKRASMDSCGAQATGALERKEGMGLEGAITPRTQTKKEGALLSPFSLDARCQAENGVDPAVCGLACCVATRAPVTPTASAVVKPSGVSARIPGGGQDLKDKTIRARKTVPHGEPKWRPRGMATTPLSQPTLCRRL